MRHPAQYSRHKQGNSTDYISGSNSDKLKKVLEPPLKLTNKQTASVKAVNLKFTTNQLAS